MKYFSKLSLFTLLIFATVFAQVDHLDLPTPDANVSLGIGFNYDYLRSPFDLDYENARGIYTVNIPIRFVVGYEMIDQILASAGNPFTDGEYFTPHIAARQFPNTTIKVDVPMLWGVCSFSYMNVMALRYENATGIPTFRFAPPPEETVSQLILGNLNTPFEFSLGWESMTFGYVYRFENFRIPTALGINLHRQRFHFRGGGNADIDVLGEITASVEGSNIPIELNYVLRNSVSGEYSLERWTPTFAARFWNFDFFARVMFRDQARGAITGKYVVPFFVDPSTFGINERLLDNDIDYLMENIKNGNFAQNATDTVSLYTNNNLKWELPSVLTFKYNIIPEHLSVSYSKFIGKTSLQLVDPSTGLYGHDEDGSERRVDFLQDGLDLRTSLHIDHLIMINGRLGWFYGSLGIMSLDIDAWDDKGILRNQNEPYLIPYGKGVMLPLLSGGGIIGTKLQFLLELNLLPLTAFKTGLVYHF
jgi:hypothetical protein